MISATVQQLLLHLLASVFLCQLHDLIILAHNIAEVFSFMGKQTICTVFNAFVCIFKVSSALISQSVQRAIAKQAIKILRIIGFMAGKILTFFMTEKRIFFSFSIKSFFTHNLTSFPATRPGRKFSGKYNSETLNISSKKSRF